MSRIIRLGEVQVGEGLPKICVPLVGSTYSEIISEAEYMRELNFDLLEWRVDYYKEADNIEKLKETLMMIRSILPSKPVIFTLRSIKEGGNKEVDGELYLRINKSISASKLVEAIDIELSNMEADIKRLIEEAHNNNTAVILSSHDFVKTPPLEELLTTMERAFKLGGDISKMAVMPNSAKDILTMLDATRIMSEEYDKGPIVTMSMSTKGIITRLCGELFGSAITFGAAQKTSAPGQISVVDLHRGIQLLHLNK